MNNGMPPPQYPQQPPRPQPQAPQQAMPPQQPPQSQQSPQYPYPGQFQAPITKKPKFAINPSTIMVVVMTLLFIIAGGFGVWAYGNYASLKSDYDGKVANETAGAKKAQAEEDAKKYAEKEKEPNRTFVGPDDYGRVTFEYPKTWSTYIESGSDSGGIFKAVLNPSLVEANSKLLALRVMIQQADTGSILQRYDAFVRRGDLKSSSIIVNGVQGTRLDGKFSQDVIGSMVIFKIRDKTLTIQTDSQAFMPDFEKLIKTIKFNQ